MCALASIMNLTSNEGNLEFLLYFKRNFGQDSIISAQSWWMLFLPMELLAFGLHWQFMWITFLHHLVAEFVPAVMIVIWLGIYVASVSGMIRNAPGCEKLELDFLVIVALFSLPWTWRGKPPTAGLRRILQRLPWGAVITYGSTFTLSFIVKSSKFAAWLRDHLISLQAHSRLLSQASLTVCAAFMTELLSSRHTVGILLPVATEAALVRPCNPLYYALPVTVAASSSVVFPTARITIALLSELTDMGPLSMLLYGILLKALIVTCALISVDTLGHQVFNWSALPAWMLSHQLNTSGPWLARPSTPHYVQQLGPPVL
ncbi:solute carrier family 13 member 2-like [Dermacentor silvarum]|uniref:solute carrier family 13 member 2-like n=1 Tax=Dermacentor silvarum TaxID=543639 RepID=UPI002100D240|nr:solute carrier family 13 member 2-like [Dermacentor silvarum]